MTFPSNIRRAAHAASLVLDERTCSAQPGDQDNDQTRNHRRHRMHFTRSMFRATFVANSANENLPGIRRGVDKDNDQVASTKCADIAAHPMERDGPLSRSTKSQPLNLNSKPHQGGQEMKKLSQAHRNQRRGSLCLMHRHGHAGRARPEACDSTLRSFSPPPTIQSKSAMVASIKRPGGN